MPTASSRTRPSTWAIAATVSGCGETMPAAFAPRRTTRATRSAVRIANGTKTVRSSSSSTRSPRMADDAAFGCRECGKLVDDAGDGTCPECGSRLIELGGDPSPDKAAALIAFARRDATHVVESVGAVGGAVLGAVIAAV